MRGERPQPFIDYSPADSVFASMVSITWQCRMLW